jgi:signal transduction histidine kinase
MENHFLSSLIFPWILLSKDREIIDRGDGAVFQTPSNLLIGSPSFYKNLVAKTWSSDTCGYAVYPFSVETLPNYLVVLHGMKVTGISTARGKSDRLSVRTDTKVVEHYVETFLKSLDDIGEFYKRLIRENIHEIRGINSGLYNAAYELQQRLEITHANDLLPLSKNIVGLSQILTGRIDFMDFIANPSAVQAPKVEFGIYKKFDKVQRCFRVTANNRKINLILSGSSIATVSGPPIFDLIPYLLIENAIKYALENTTINVICNDSSKRTICQIKSVGPEVEKDEIDYLFEPEFRGKNARRTGKSGSGLGLSVLRRLVENVFSGEITFSQSDPSTQFNRIPYRETIFEVKFPIRQS